MVGKVLRGRRRCKLPQVSKVNLYFVAVLVAMLLMVTYVPVGPTWPVEMFFR